MLLYNLFPLAALAAPASFDPVGSPDGLAFGESISNSVTPSIFQISAPFQYYGGPIIPKVKLVLLLWGGKEKVQFASELELYYKNLVKSPWMNTFSQYPDANGNRVTQGSFIGTFSDDSAPIGTVSDSAVKTHLLELIAAGKIPKQDENTLYQIHGPVGTTFTYFGDNSCSGKFYAYHSSVGSPAGNVFYSMVPSHTNNGCSKVRCGDKKTEKDINECVLTSQKLSGSHELAEALVNPAYEIKPQNFPQVSPLFWGKVTNFGLYLQDWRRKTFLGKFFQLDNVPATISDQDIKDKLATEILNGNLNLPTPATTFAVHLPPRLKIKHGEIDCPPLYQMPYTNGSVIAVITDCNPVTSADDEPLLPLLQKQVDLDFDRLNQPRLVGWTFNRGALEIADACGEQLGKTSVDGKDFLVTKVWSAKDNGCIV